jgi:hypothetical protein
MTGDTLLCPQVYLLILTKSLAFPQLNLNLCVRVTEFNLAWRFLSLRDNGRKDGTQASEISFTHPLKHQELKPI